MATEQEKAELAKKRGAAARYIKDPEQRQKFVAAQGQAEYKQKNNDAGPDVYRRLASEADTTVALEGSNFANMRSYKNGIDRVPKTGPAKLHKGEAVLNKADAAKYRMAKMPGKGMMMGALSGAMPKKKMMVKLVGKRNKAGK